LPEIAFQVIEMFADTHEAIAWKVRSGVIHFEFSVPDSASPCDALGS